MRKLNLDKWVGLIACFLMAVVFEPRIAVSTTCDEDCHERCRQCIEYDLGFIKDEKCIIEPQCHLGCEAEKKLACAIETPIPQIPFTPTNPLNPRLWKQSCKAPFEALTHSTIAYCANWTGRADDLDDISRAQRTLEIIGIAKPGELSGVDIRWCPLNGSGMVPESGRILLHPNLKKDLFNLHATLAHELQHIRQHRRWGSDEFKCRYSRELVAGRGQGRANSVEREAYEYEDQVKSILNKGRPLEICNRSSKMVYAAYGYTSGATWKAKGWYRFSPGECGVVANQIPGVAYAYATDNPRGAGANWTSTTNPVNFCVDSKDAFDINDGPCERQAHEDYHFVKFGIIFRGGDGLFTWTVRD